MAYVEPAAATIDLEVLLQPISEDNPSGESLQYSGIYDEIREARRADLNLSQGDWRHELKVADYRQVIYLAVPALETQTKDLQIAAWLAESLTRENGFAGLRDALRLMDGLQQNFWETCFPEIDEGDQEGRANAVELMDRLAAEAAYNVALTNGGSNLSYYAWQESKRFDIPDNLENLETADQEKFAQLRAQAEEERRTTGDVWRKAKTQTRRAFYETLSLTLDECWESYTALDRTIEEKFDRNQTPGMTNLKKALDEIRAPVKKLLQEKREQEPDPPEAADEDDSAIDDDSNGSYAENGAAANAGGAAALSIDGALLSRRDALRRLSEVADFFRQTEPHSPISYLVQRAVKWGNMPLDDWLQEVIKDEAVLGQLRETLGFGAAPGDVDSGYSESETSADSAESTDSSW